MDGIALRCLVLLLAGQPLAWAKEGQPSLEYSVKASLIFNFARYAAWPDKTFRNRAEPLVIGVHGKDPFGKALKSLEKRKVAGRKIVVRAVSKRAELLACHIVFFGKSKAAVRKRALEWVRSRPVLVVGEDKDFARKGGAIGFGIRKSRGRSRVTFEVNQDALARHRLRLHAKALRFGKVVRDRK